MSETEFNPRSGIISMGGKAQYLQVAARVRWIRQQEPNAIMTADLVHFDPQAGYAVVKAVVTLPGGAHAEDYGSAWRHVLEKKNVQQPDDVVEWATTTAYGRALGRLGFDTGTALDESPDLPVDAPVQRAPQAPQRPQERPHVPARPNAPQGTVPVLPKPNAPHLASGEQLERCKALVSALGWGAQDRATYLAGFGVQSFGALTADQMRDVIPDLTAKAAEMHEGVPA